MNEELKRLLSRNTDLLDTLLAEKLADVKNDFYIIYNNEWESENTLETTEEAIASVERWLDLTNLAKESKIKLDTLCGDSGGMPEFTIRVNSIKMIRHLILCSYIGWEVDLEDKDDIKSAIEEIIEQYLI